MASKPINWPKLIGEAVFFSSIQSSYGSVEMSSKFSVINFCKDQDTLQNAANALKSYVIIGLAWTAGTMLSMYAKYGVYGAIAGFTGNMIFILWIYFSYVHAFSVAAEKYKLKPPTVFW